MGGETARGVRQECLLSPLLFNVLLTDVEKVMGRVKLGRVKLGERRCYTVGYADDLVLMAEGKDELRSMMARFEEYLDGKRLELNTEKTRIMRFRKGGDRMRKRDWRCKGKVLGGEGIQICGIRDTEEWKAENAGEG